MSPTPEPTSEPTSAPKSSTKSQSKSKTNNQDTTKSLDTDRLFWFDKSGQAIADKIRDKLCTLKVLDGNSDQDRLFEAITTDWAVVLKFFNLG